MMTPSPPLAFACDLVLCVWFRKGTTERGGFVEREREKAAREEKSESGKEREREMCELKWGEGLGGWILSWIGG